MSTLESSPRLVSQESSTIIEGTEEVTSGDQISLFRGCVLEGRWDYVIVAYRNDSEYHKIRINESRGTALHVAVNDGKVELVNTLVGAILSHEGREVVRGDSALRSTNERGDTPLHLAASRGFIGMCKCIIGENGERKDLIRVRNNKGEAPLFRAVLTCQTMAFVYLRKVSKDLDVPLMNYDGDTILHHAIWREFLDLAIIITHCYPGLVNTRNKDGATPLKVLACKPSAFKSGSNLPWWKQILYYGILVEPLDAKKSYMEKVEKFEDHELKVNIYLEHEAEKAQISVEQKYATSVRFVKSVVRFALKCVSLLGLGFTVRDLKAIKKIRQKHKWGRQLLNIFMKRPYESYMGITGGQSFMKFDRGDRDLVQPFITHQQLQLVGASSGQNQEENTIESAAVLNQQLKSAAKKEEEVSAYLTAARNGIKEIVFELQSKIPSVVHETSAKSENVLLVAVKNKQVNVVEMLRKNLDKEIFDSLILEMDDRENTVLHLAAGASSNEKTWERAGTTMQMIWDVKWYEYISGLVPEQFIYRLNKDGETAWEIMELKHMKKVKDCSEALKDLSNSGSVVAALIAGVSFATSSSVPGSTEHGKPIFSGQPAFDVFAIASLFGLGFSITALVMFLAILTSPKQAQDFRLSLPLKLIFGLGSLFASVASMLVSFWAAHFFVLNDKYKIILFPVCVATCLPLTIYALMQFPFYVDLVKLISKKVLLPYRNEHSFTGPTPFS